MKINKNVYFKNNSHSDYNISQKVTFSGVVMIVVFFLVFIPTLLSADIMGKETIHTLVNW